MGIEQHLKDWSKRSLRTGAYLGVALGCATAGTYLGSWAGHGMGHVIDTIPVLRDAAPWVAQRSGIEAYNTQIYATMGGLIGLGAGLIPVKMALARRHYGYQ